MFSISEIKLGKAVKVNGEPYIVISAQHLKMGRGGAILKTKLKNLVSGNVLEKTFKGADKIEEAELENTKADFLYKDKSDYHFMDQVSFEQFSLMQGDIGEASKFLKEGCSVTVLNFENRPVSITIPVKVKLKVTSAPPGVRGDTAQGGITKSIILETGAVVNAPLFVKEGDEIIVNTERGEYVERA